MTRERLNALFKFYKDFAEYDLKQGSEDPDRYTSVLPAFANQKLIDLCERALAPEMQADDKLEKSMRWLGFVQGVLWALDAFTVEDLKNHSRPDFLPPVWD